MDVGVLEDSLLLLGEPALGLLLLLVVVLGDGVLLGSLRSNKVLRHDSPGNVDVDQDQLGIGFILPLSWPNIHRYLQDQNKIEIKFYINL